MTSDKQELAALLADTAAADRHAFAEFYIRTSKRVYGLICDLNTGQETRFQAMQDVYLLVWEKASQYRPAVEDPMAWTMSLVHRHAVDQARRSSSHVAGPASPLDAQYLRPDTSPIAELDSGERESIRMAYGAGMTYQKVAEALGVTEGTTKGRIRDGMRNLNHHDPRGPAR